MIKKKKAKVIVVMPAYNAAKTLARTVKDIPSGLVEEIILVDDRSTDETVAIAEKLDLTVFSHPQNLGYGGNQKTCYWEALKRQPEVVIMLHPDYQYDATLLKELVRPILDKRFDLMLGSRIRTREEAIKGGMPTHKYFFNRIYTLMANFVLGVNFSEHMSGLRAFSVRTLKEVPFQRFSNDFVFDQQFTIAAIAKGLKIGEISIPVRYYEESSSIQFWPGVKFGLESLGTLILYLIHKWKVYHSKIF